MARNLRQYLVDENTPVSPEWVRRVFGDIDARIDALEQIKADWQAAVDVLTAQALQRIDEALLPAFEEVQALTSVGAFFTATSASDVAVGTGLKTFIVDEPRKNFVPAEYVVVSSAGAPDIGMAGRLVSYDPETGELVVNVELASGTGSRNDWRISVGTPPDLTHAGRTDNPHGVTWDQVGAAAAVHGHQMGDVSGLEAALAGKLDNTVAAFADRIDTLNENTAPNGSEFVPCSDGQKVALSMLLGGNIETGPGWVKLGDGVIIQCFEYLWTDNFNASKTITYPTTFPTQVLGGAFSMNVGRKIFSYTTQEDLGAQGNGISSISWGLSSVSVTLNAPPRSDNYIPIMVVGW